MNIEQIPVPTTLLSEFQYYPDEVHTSREMILYALRRAGELPYYKLLLLTGLDISLLNNELEQLIADNKIFVTRHGGDADCFANSFSSSSFRLNRNN